VGLSLWAFSPAAASAAVCFLAFGDVAATTIGQRFGKTKIGNKSLEGTVAFVLAALFGGYLLSFAEPGISLGIMILGALVAAGVELLPLPLNDNLTIPLLAGAAMELALRWGK
jgi:glycerol-3-phosphate acyltransferase PlsY